MILLAHYDEEKLKKQLMRYKKKDLVYMITSLCKRQDEGIPEVIYVEDGCYKWTFQAKKVKKFVEDNCQGDVLNLFAGKTRLNIMETRVDMSDEFDPDVCVDAAEYLELPLTFDTIIYDPPWNERKSKEFYEGRYIGKFTKLKNGIVSLLDKSGIIISAGYEITNFGRSRGMLLTKLLVVNPKGEIRPYFISIEKQIPNLGSYIDVE